MTGFTLRDMILNGWPVLSVLLGMSIVSITVIVDRALAFRAVRCDIQAFVSNCLRLIDAQGPEHAYKQCARYPLPIAVVVAAILSAPSNREARERAAQNGLQSQLLHLETFLPALATIASTAPFVGLLGTVVGIIKAFQDIAVSTGGGPQVVAAGIAEALITTAFGLFVAIPAVVAYNIYARRLQRLAQQVELSIFALIEKLETMGETHGERFRLQ